ncbi:MAG: helix-turn-helix domain-containing protein [Pseudomonadota bacterium]
MSKANRKGRSKTGPRFVQMFHYVMDSAAWRSLSPAERTVLLELARRYDGANNGRLAMSERDAARACNISRTTASNAFDRLVECGFIECTQRGAFSVKTRLAAEWRLTYHRCDRTGATPSKAFLIWKPGMKPPQNAEHGTRIEPLRDQNRASQALHAA